MTPSIFLKIEEILRTYSKLKLNQPMNMTVLNEDEALAASDQIGFPMVVRPSYMVEGQWN